MCMSARALRLAKNLIAAYYRIILPKDNFDFYEFIINLC